MRRAPMGYHGNMRPVRKAAHAMLGAIFVVEGARALADPEPLVGKAKPTLDRLAPVWNRMPDKVPTDHRTLIRANGAAQFAGGALLMTGRFTRVAALLL